MKVRDLIENLQRCPLDAEVLAWDPDGERMTPVTGTLYVPEETWLDVDDTGEGEVVCTGPALTLYTDDS